MSVSFVSLSTFFFFNDTATTEIYTLSLHDALPISSTRNELRPWPLDFSKSGPGRRDINRFLSLPSSTRVTFSPGTDRKSTRLNSSHQIISYAVFCLKKKRRIGELRPSCLHATPPRK